MKLQNGGKFHFGTHVDDVSEFLHFGISANRKSKNFVLKVLKSRVAIMSS
jgi:hypothetical protein